MSGTAYDALRKRCRESPPVAALVLGSGLGEVVDRWGRELSVPFAELPDLTESSVQGHRGQLSLVRLHSQPVLVLEGRLHFYEGHSWERVTQPTCIIAGLGAKVILHTNAAGGIHEALTPGSLMLITNQVELNRPTGWREFAVGSMPSPYSERLRDKLLEAASRTSDELHTGVYASCTGPSYETGAEIRAMKNWGIDAVGMSTSREVLRGVELGMECAAVSCITNRAAGLSDVPLSHEDVLRIAAAQSNRLAALIEGFVDALGEGSPKKG